MNPSPQELLAVARMVAAEAAELVADRARTGVSVAATKSSTVDVVTEADRASEELIRRRLGALRSGDAVLGEELGETSGEHNGVRWIVDPIDGTVNFLYGIPEYAVSMAAEVDGTVVAGVVRNAASGVEYAAALGGGALRDGQPIGVRPAPPLSESLVLTGFGYDSQQRAVQAAAIARLLPQVRDIRRMGACALDLCHIAEGSADAYAEEGVNLWDFAAGALVAREAGARTTMLPGAFGRELLACAPAESFDRFVHLLVSSGLTAPGIAPTGPVE